MNGGSTLTPTPSPDGAGGPVTGLGRPPGPGWEQVGRPGHTERAPWRPNRRSWPDNHRPEQRPGPGWDGEYAPALQPGATPPPPMLHIRQQGALRLQPTHQLSNASRGVGKASRAIFVHRHVQYPFAHVDPCCRLVHLSPPWSWCDNGGAGTLHTCIAGLTHPCIRSEQPGALWEGCPTARRCNQAVTPGPPNDRRRAPPTYPANWPIRGTLTTYK